MQELDTSMSSHLCKYIYVVYISIAHIQKLVI